MPRASWRGSLVSCPIFLSPATTRTKPIRLDQVATSGGRFGRGRFVGSGRKAEGSAGSVPRLLAENGGPDGDQSPAATRITLRPHDPRAGEEIEKREVVKGYESSLWPGAAIIGIDFDIDRLQLLGG
jgi:non-homologous end joining protein Ku